MRILFAVLPTSQMWLDDSYEVVVIQNSFLSLANLFIIDICYPDILQVDTILLPVDLEHLLRQQIVVHLFQL